MAATLTSHQSNSNEYSYQIGDEFNDSRYVIIGYLGHRSYGEVFLVRDKKDVMRKAMKSIFNFDLNRDTLREIEIMKSIRHDNLLKYYDSFKTQNIIHNLIIEYCDGGDLANLIQTSKKENRVIPRQSISEWNRQILRGIDYLHSIKIIHRDIKPENIFLDHLSTLIKIANLDYARDPDSLSKSNDEYCGTFNYMSPQMVNNEPYTEKTDVWSFGCLVYELLSLRKAFYGKNIFDILDSIVKNKPKTIEGIETEFSFILNNTLKLNENDRYPAKLLLESFAHSKKQDRLYEKMQHSFEISNKIVEVCKTNIYQEKDCIGTLRGHDGPVLSLATDNHGHVFSGSADKTIKVWNINNQQCESTIQGHVLSVWVLLYINNEQNSEFLNTSSPDFGSLVSGSADKTIKVWNLRTGECIKTLLGHDSYVYALQIDQKGRLLSGSNDTTIKLWNLQSGQCFKTLIGHQDCINAIVAINKEEIASCSGDSSIKVWNLENSSCLKTLTGHDESVNALYFLSKINCLVSGADDKSVKLWDLERGECLKTLKGHDSYVYSLLSLGDRLFSSSDDGSIKIWNTESGECLKTITQFDFSIYSLCLVNFESKSFILAGFGDKCAKLFEID